MRIVVFIEGGLVSGVVDLDAPSPSKGIEYEVVDYDVLEDNGGQDTKEYFERRSPELMAYMEKNLPNEWAMIQDAIKDAEGATTP